VFCKKWTFPQRRVHYVQYHYFLFFILLIWGLRAHPTHPPPAYGPALCDHTACEASCKQLYCVYLPCFTAPRGFYGTGHVQRSADSIARLTGIWREEGGNEAVAIEAAGK